MDSSDHPLRPGFGLYLMRGATRAGARIVFFLALTVAAAAHAAAALPAVYSLPAEALAAARDRMARGDPSLAPVLERLRADADHAMQFKPVSVMDKSRVPPSGDKHDYLSQAPYWWPDPATPDGLPFIRHDGSVYPPSKEATDARPWESMVAKVETLALAYYFTHHEPYAGHAALLVRAWFLDPATRMNPNLRFGQYIPGRNDGRGGGILEMRHLARVCDAVALIADSPAWTEADNNAFHQWLAAYFDWLTTSPNGLDEAAAENNHGSWYDVQAAHLALVLGKTDFAKKILAAGLKKRIARQIEPDGSQPLELVRTKSLSYSLFNLEALCNLAILAKHVDLDWWAYTAEDGQSLRTALRYLAAYTDPSKPWIENDLVSASRTELLPLLAEALRHGDDPQFRELLEKFGLSSPGQRAARWRLISPLHE
jgi:hypothetical protein